MSAEPFLGPYLAILLMAVATYLCRVAGVVAMRHLPVTGRVERGLKALPGSIVVATVLPIAVEAGLPAALGLAAAVGAMVATRFELAALAAGLGTVALARAFGL
jgi:uncharacterized membrane protein